MTLVMNLKLKKTSLSILILTIFVISSINYTSAGLDQIGVEAGDTFTFVVEKEHSTSDGLHGFLIAGLLFHEGAEFTVEVVNALVHTDSRNWIYLDITYNETTTRVENTIEGDGNIIISNDWAAQRPLFDGGINFLNELVIVSYGGSGSASIVDNTEHFGLTYNFQFTNAGSDFAVSQTTLYEKSTGVMISDEYSNAETKSSPPDRLDEYFVVRKGFSDEGGILENLPGFGLVLSFSSIMIIVILIRFKHSKLE